MKKVYYSNKLKPLSSHCRNLLFFLSILLLIAVLAACGTGNGGGTLTLATTTSVNDSGLLTYLQPEFEKDTGISLKVVAQGSGQAMKTGENGDADVLLVHSPKAEDEFVSKGFGLKRIGLMYNYFVIVGPKDNPAKVTKDMDASSAFKAILDTKSKFISRGDNSGTNTKELSIWDNLKVKPSEDWYVSAGKGMGDVLSMASEMKAYTLTDTATYYSMQDKLDLQIIVNSAPDLKNQYSIIAVNPEKHNKINKEGAQRFIDWMTSDKAIKLINEYGKDKYGSSLFTVNYTK